MKKLLLILLCLPMIGFGQLTSVPDDNFEQALINLGYDNTLDNFVLTANINTVTILDVSNDSISDLTGIEDFTALTNLECNDNQLTSLDVSQNTALTYLNCWGNQLTNLGLTTNINLQILYCFDNSLTTLDISQNINLQEIKCWENQLTSLDVTSNINLTEIWCQENPLISLDIDSNLALMRLNVSNTQLSLLDLSNNLSLESLRCSYTLLDSLDLSVNNDIRFFWCENNLNLIYLNLGITNIFSGGSGYSIWMTNNPNLYCINVVDPIWSTLNWTISNGNISPWNAFSDSCNLEILGCSDTNACNFDANATLNNGSCNFPSSQILNLNECDSFLWAGVVYDTSGGPYVDTLTTIGGCDSIIYLMLTINISNNSITTINTCDSYLWNDSVYIASGNYIYIDTNIVTCDSIILDLTINYSTSSFDTLSTNNSYSWNGNTYTNSGDYSDALTNSVGCDSIVYLNLTITNTTGILDIANTTKLVKITDMLGQETPYSKNTPLFYIYDDGTVEKRIVIE